MDRILIIMKKNNGHQGIICPFTGAFFHNMQTCLLVYTYNRSQVSVYRTIGPLVLIFAPKHRLWVLVRNASAGEAVLTCTHNLCFEQK